MYSPEYSIITTTYNRAPIISKTILSVLRQTFKDFEYIIIDDGSTDNTEDVVKSFNDPRISYFKIKNSERGYARNFGIKKASGKYLTILDSDDYYFDNALEIAQEFKALNNNPVYFANGYQEENSKGEILYKVTYPKSNFIENMCKSNISAPCGIFIKREVFLENLFIEDRKFKIAEDLYVFLKIAAKYPLLANNIVTGGIIEHPTNTMCTLNPYEVLYCRDKIIDLLKLDPLFANYSKSLKHLHTNLSSLAIFSFTNEGDYKKAFYLISKLLFKHPSEILRKRTIVIFRNILFNIFKRLTVNGGV